MLPKLGSHAFNLLQTDTGGDDLTATGDGDKDTFRRYLRIRLFTRTTEFGARLAPMFGQVKERDSP